TRLLDNMGSSYYSRFRRQGRLADLEQAIGYHSQAVALTPDNNPDKPHRLGNLGRAYHGRFQRLRLPHNLKVAIGYQEGAVLLIPEGHPQKAELIDNLASFCADRRNPTIGTSGTSSSSPVDRENDG
ncbi:hypothetical protein FRC08_008674, partial [Ceratobasidium sp. 394]